MFVSNELCRTSSVFIRKQGEKGKIVDVTAGDIQISGNAEILDPEHHIAALTEGNSEADMELRLVLDKWYGLMPLEEKGKPWVQLR